jgi:DNA-3-methyladenine glycosylase
MPVPQEPAPAPQEPGCDSEAHRWASLPQPRGTLALALGMGLGMGLAREFFDRPATEVGPDLLGCVLWHESVAVELTEVEAYMGRIDSASHSYRGQTRRNAVMFGPPGYCYVYFTYGMHFCANLVCGPGDTPTAVLLRAGRIVAGEELARSRRPSSRRDTDLASGPARLCLALGIDMAQNGVDVCTDGSELLVTSTIASYERKICHGPRVGISSAADLPWRYWIDGDPTVSRYRAHVPRRGKPVTPSPR